MIMLSGSALSVRRVTRFALSTLVACPLAFSAVAFGQQTPLFTPGNLVVVVEGCGVYQGTCTSVANGLGTGSGNSSAGGYGDNQAAPLTLFQFKPSGAASVSYVNSLVLPQTGSAANLPIAGEYGSSSEGGLQLSGQGQYLTLGTYGINAGLFNANPIGYGAAPSNALAQSGSLTGSTYTPIARVPTLIDAYGNVNSSSALFNIYNTNNPRSVYTADGTAAYLSGQGASGDATGGVFYSPLFKVNNAPTAITGLDTTSNTVAQDTRFVTGYNGTLYVSVDSKGGSNNARSFVGTLGKPPAMSLYSSGAGPTQLVSTNNAAVPASVSGAGKITLTASEANTINAPIIADANAKSDYGCSSNTTSFNLSPSGYFFANAYTMYIADTGNTKQTSANCLHGDGGLQKWINTKTDGTGTWVLMYTMSAGLNLVANPNAVPADTTGTTGLYGLTGVVSGSNVLLYATNSTIADLDPTYVYGISDPLAATTNPGTAFTQLATAPADSNFKGISFAPSLPAGSATINTAPEGLQVSTSGTGCAAGTYVTPVTLLWTPGSSCSLTTTATQTVSSNVYTFTQWQDGVTNTTDAVIAPSTAGIYTATFIPPTATTTTLAASSTSFPASTFATFSAHVNCNAACGSVDYREDAGDWATVVLDSNGNFVSSGMPPNTAVGPHTLTVNYLGNAQYVASTSNTINFTILAPGSTATTTTAMASSTSFSAANPGTFSVHVNCNSACGNVDYREDGGDWATVALDSNGNFVSGGMPPNSAVGQHTLTINYLGNAQYAASTSNTINFTIAPPGSTATTATLTANSTSFAASNFGNFSVHVSCNTACGNVDYREDAGDWATIVLDGNGNFVSSGTAPNTSVGQHTITVNYLGNAQYAASTSNTIGFTITQ